MEKVVGQKNRPSGSHGSQERAAADGVIDVETAREMTHGAIKREYALDRDMTPDELYDIVAEEIDAIYALG